VFTALKRFALVGSKNGAVAFISGSKFASKLGWSEGVVSLTGSTVSSVFLLAYSLRKNSIITEKTMIARTNSVDIKLD
jgi:hypothetical protein